MEAEIKAKLIEKLKEKNARKFNGYTLGLHANHIAVAVLRAKGIKKGSKEFEEQHPKIKELVKSIHKDLPAQEVDKTVKKESKAPPSIPPTQLAKETSSVQEEPVAPAPASDELKAVKAELKQLKTLLASSKTIKTELATKIQDAYRRYKQVKDAKTELSGLKQKATDDKLERIKGRLEVATATKRVKKALAKNVETKKAEKAEKAKSRTLTREEFRERMKKSREAKAKEKEPEAEEEEAPIRRRSDIQKELSDYRKSLDPIVANRYNDIALEARMKKYSHIEDEERRQQAIRRDELNDQFLHVDVDRLNNIIEVLAEDYFTKKNDKPSSRGKFPLAFKNLYDILVLNAVERNAVGDAKADYKKMFDMLKAEMYKVLPKERIEKALDDIKLNKGYSRFETDIKDMVKNMNKLIKYFK